MTEDELLVTLRVALCAEAVEEGWAPATAEKLADVAIRRWESFERRSKPNKRTYRLRIHDLVQGLRQGAPFDLIYLEPGAFERLASRFGEVLTRLP
ncbi:protein-L-isoaspartate O-methyltransferase [Allocatelliglobosispora scoriae]|uniref:Protein-L-isoaspartate O-methyltransferase n=1 Tax=Allocatelliglobosispora scoriae TaxID=643052 RepID=A0A841BUG9_9ACTN|nr:hypothetical protein [Allocatelliglobosispora scoriae]MBB5871096.1 protein-L-isoaspartate O-methyltransferase [Allocatelliglobosispora scoriae]